MRTAAPLPPRIHHCVGPMIFQTRIFIVTEKGCERSGDKSKSLKGADRGRQCISPVVIYWKCGKRRLTEKKSEPTGAADPPPSTRLRQWREKGGICRTNVKLHRTRLTYHRKAERRRIEQCGGGGCRRRNGMGLPMPQIQQQTLSIERDADGGWGRRVGLQRRNGHGAGDGAAHVNQRWRRMVSRHDCRRPDVSLTHAVIKFIELEVSFSSTRPSIDLFSLYNHHYHHQQCTFVGRPLL